jgi:hypothetical protein
MRRTTCLLFSLFAGFTLAQTPPDPAPAAPAPSAWSAGPIEFSGLVDAYYSFNFNHPITRNNVIRNFDAKANQFSLNMAKLTMEHSADPVGFKFEIAGGRAMDLFHATDPAGVEVYKHIFQAYASFKPENWKGLQVDVGKFVTSAGAEPTETHLNWNYSRSLLYALGPYYHFGLRASYPVNSNFSVGAQLVNGWNNVEDNNSGKTGGFTTALTTSKFNWFNTYYVGNEKPDGGSGVRHFYDTVLGINPNGRVAGTFNFDYGVDKNPVDGDAVFYGFSAAMRVLGNDVFAFSPRYDWYKDRDGFMSGQAQTLQAFTLTADVKMKEGLLTRFEYRRDSSGLPYFDRGNEPGSATKQNTLLAGFVVYFGPSR